MRERETVGEGERKRGEIIVHAVFSCAYSAARPLLCFSKTVPAEDFFLANIFVTVQTKRLDVEPTQEESGNDESEEGSEQ